MPTENNITVGAIQPGERFGKYFSVYVMCDVYVITQ